MHSCDNPPCIKDGHLSAGTTALNNADAKAKGRHAHGETGGGAKLSEATVQAILKSPDTSYVLAAMFGVCPGTVRKIRRGERWAHIEGDRRRRPPGPRPKALATHFTIHGASS